MKYVKAIHQVSKHIVLVTTASGIWATTGFVGHNTLITKDDRPYLRWVFQCETWRAGYWPNAKPIDVKSLLCLHKSLLTQYAWMLVSPLSWKNDGIHKYVDMPVI